VNDTEKVRDALAAGGDDFPASYRNGHEALDRIESALRALTAEHGSQCQCAGCAVLREAPPA